MFLKNYFKKKPPRYLEGLLIFSFMSYFSIYLNIPSPCCIHTTAHVHV